MYTRVLFVLLAYLLGPSVASYAQTRAIIGHSARANQPALGLVHGTEGSTVFDYWWISSSTVILFEPATGFQGDYRYRYVRLDAPSRQSTLMQGLWDIYPNEAVQPSNDGRFFLLRSSTLNNPERVVVDAAGHTVDKQIHNHNLSSDAAVWQPDNSGWVELDRSGFDGRLVVYRLGRSGRHDKLPPHIANHDFGGNATLLGMADKNHVIASERVNASRFRIASVGLDGVTESGWPINLSCDSIDAEIIEVALSRDGKHLVYSVMTPIDTHNLLTVGTYVTFYVCDLNGAGLHSVFRLLMPKFMLMSSHVEDPSVDRLPRTLKWTPDGKRLCFLYNGKLWAFDIAGRVGQSGKHKTEMEPILEEPQ